MPATGNFTFNASIAFAFLTVQTDRHFINTSRNGTTEPANSSAQWNLMSEFFVCIALSGFTLNGLALARFITDRTPFNIIIILLLSLNLFSSLTQWGLIALATLYRGRGKFFMGQRVCDLNLLANVIVSALLINTHGLLAVNRAWAVVHPFSYRRLHSQRGALRLVAGLCGYVILVTFPFWLMDAVTYRLPLEVNGCNMNIPAQAVYNVTASLLIYTLPVVVVWVAFVVVVLHTIMRIRRRKRALRPRDVPLAGMSLDGTRTIPATNTTATTATKEPPGKNPRWRSYTVLTLLTVSVTVCYMPRTIYAGLRLFIPSISDPFFFQVASMLFACQLILDPILLTLTMGKIPSVRCGM
ncbi:hypothetical protein BV898_16367 [Hypsibius exemplaris]|uniref:G-protein coupled receptors family 1 profile domain-containing protein n=1 Tax=Hypsibius exemplaris TaxID=2072580 RepID=A0A9X6RLR6_HYPEX|nr:hypothetical protein BV898_16367 [Hypsibius exemplaris]